MAPQNSILYPWPPFNVPWPLGGPLGPRLGTPVLEQPTFQVHTSCAECWASWKELDAFLHQLFDLQLFSRETERIGRRQEEALAALSAATQGILSASTAEDLHAMVNSGYILQCWKRYFSVRRLRRFA